MQKKRPWLSLLVVVAAIAAEPAAWSAGLGAGGQAAVLGQPLDFVVQVRVEPGDALAPDCVGAEVHVGDRRLQSSQVRTLLEPLGPESARIRVLTTLSIDEPVVGIQVHAGCNARVSRRYVVLADPPSSAPAPMVAAPAFAAAPPLIASAPVADAAPMPRAPAAASMGTPVASANTRSIAQRSDPERTAAQAAARAQRRAQAQARRSAAAANNNATRRTATAPAATTARAAPASRLRLDVSEPTPVAATRTAAAASVEAQMIDQAFEAVAQAASAARAAAQAASAASQRIASLERTVGELRTQAQGDRELAVQLRDRLVLAEGSSRWLWPLVASVLLLAALALWLVRRVGALQRERNSAWRMAAAMPHAAQPPPGTEGPASRHTTPIPFVTAEVRPPAEIVTRPRATPAWPPPSTPEPEGWKTVSTTQTLPLPMGSVGPATSTASDAESAVQRTDILPVNSTARGDETAARDVSIEELIDLEQQAEFFVVLGQDDAAVDLLVEHLRHTGGGSPLPYLKLLEIYRRRGDRADYERMRTRFNQRFNAHAPDWGIDLAAGRSLEDYPGIVPRLQQAWPRPLDAMAEMEALLFRKSRGELFDLPAYREVLFLYALARDLLDREAVSTGNVDLLLPLAEGGEFGVTSPAPYMGLERDTGPDTLPPPFDDRPTAPVDLDLTVDHDPPTSIFDPFDAPTDPRPRRF